jgi:hypothetical protein
MERKQELTQLGLQCTAAWMGKVSAMEALPAMPLSLLQDVLPSYRLWLGELAGMLQGWQGLVDGNGNLLDPMQPWHWLGMCMEGKHWGDEAEANETQGRSQGTGMKQSQVTSQGKGGNSGSTPAEGLVPPQVAEWEEMEAALGMGNFRKPKGKMPEGWNKSPGSLEAKTKEAPSGEFKGSGKGGSENNSSKTGKFGEQGKGPSNASEEGVFPPPLSKKGSSGKLMGTESPMDGRSEAEAHDAVVKGREKGRGPVMSTEGETESHGRSSRTPLDADIEQAGAETSVGVVNKHASKGRTSHFLSTEAEAEAEKPEVIANALENQTPSTSSRKVLPTHQQPSNNSQKQVIFRGLDAFAAFVQQPFPGNLDESTETSTPLTAQKENPSAHGGKEANDMDGQYDEDFLTWEEENIHQEEHPKSIKSPKITPDTVHAKGAPKTSPKDPPTIPALQSIANGLLENILPTSPPSHGPSRETHNPEITQHEDSPQEHLPNPGIQRKNKALMKGQQERPEVAISFANGASAPQWESTGLPMQQPATQPHSLFENRSPVHPHREKTPGLSHDQFMDDMLEALTEQLQRDFKRYYGA